MPGKDFIPKNYSTGDKFTAADETEVQRELNEQEGQIETLFDAIDDMPDEFFDFYDSAAGKPDGAFSTSSNGKPLVNAITVAGADLTVATSPGLGSFYVSSYTGAGSSAGYKQFDNGSADSATTYVEMVLQFIDGGGTKGGSFCFATNVNLLNFAGGPALEVPIHIVFASSYISVGTFINGTFSEIQAIPYTGGDTGSNKFKVQWGVDYDTGELWVRDPSNVPTRIQNDRFKVKGRYSFFEIFYANSATDNRGVIWSVRSSSISMSSPQAYVTPLRGLAEDARLLDRVSAMLSGKLDASTSTSVVYAVNSSGVTTMLPYSATSMSSGRVRTTGTGGTIVVGDAVAANQAVSLSQLQASIASLIDSSPALLDTFKEVAAALNNDPAFATTIMNLLAGKQPKHMTGTVGTAASTAAKTVTLDAPNASYVPVPGDQLMLTFTLGQSANAPTLAVNGGTAYPLTAGGNNTNINMQGQSGLTKIPLIFDGTSWNSPGAWYNNAYSIATASEFQTGTGSTGRVISAAIASTLLLVAAAAKPASATATGRAGQFFVDSTGLYVCIATNSWLKMTGATF